MLRWLFGPRDEPFEPRSFPPVEVIPGRLRCRAFAHRITGTKEGSLDCWSFVTDGLRPLGHRELILTLVRLPGESIEPLAGDVFSMFASIHRLAAGGAIAHAGSLTVLGKNGFPGAPTATGIAWTSARPLDGVDPALGTRLAGVLLLGEETAVAQAAGATRVLSHLGKAWRHYPTPLWSDRRRTPLLGASALEASLLTRIGSMPLAGAYVRMDGSDELRLRILEGARERLAGAVAQLPPGAPFALKLEVDPEATACLVWGPGQREMEGISAPSHEPERPRLAGGFLAVAPGVEQDEARPFEDGFMLLLTAGTWAELLGCLREGRPFERALGAMRFELSWIPQRYENPIDGTVLVSEDGLQVAEPAERTSDVKVVLLTGLDELPRRIELSALGTYIRELQTAAGSWPAGPGALLLQLDLAPHEPALVRARRGELTEADPPLREGCAALARLPVPKVTAPVTFQLVWPR